jgi:hypothetical protein
MMNNVDNDLIKGSLKIRVGNKEAWLLRREWKRRNGNSKTKVSTSMVFKKEEELFEELRKVDVETELKPVKEKEIPNMTKRKLTKPRKN